MDANRQRSQSHDPIQLNLDAVTRRLVRPHFLHNLTPSRLPSQAASSESSLSPRGDNPRSARGSFGQPSHHRHSHLKLAVTYEDVPEDIDLVLPLIQDPPVDENAPSVDPRVLKHLESHFLGARHAYAKMASDRNFQTFPHGHQDLVLAVDFNYFGTRMVTASSDHRLKVWDKKDDSWALVDSWKAHDAEIVDVGILWRLSNLQPGRWSCHSHPSSCIINSPPSFLVVRVRSLIHDRSNGMALSWERLLAALAKMAAASSGKRMS
jgi:nucleoporin SEH1